MADDNNDNSKKNRLIPLTLWPKFHPWPSIGGLRHLVFYAKGKNFEGCFIRKNGRILIDEHRFFEWAKQSDAA